MGKLMRHLTSKLIATAAIAVCASQAHAIDSINFLGYAHGSESVTYALTALPGHAATGGTASAGGFLTTLNGSSPSFTTYCVDLYQSISFNTPYSPYSLVSSHSFANGRAYADLARLYSSAAPLVNNSVTEAAFQMAVWEIAYETTPGAYSLGSGAATFSSTSALAAATAADWLGHLGNGNGMVINVRENGEHQDVVYASSVPEPETYALMMGGLMAVGYVARRRRAQR
jgi:PEP-CTERM motif